MNDIIDIVCTRQEALKRLKTADHMLNIMYPSLQEPKILIAVLENIFLGLTYSLTALLYHELNLKRIPKFKDNFESKFKMFRNRICLRYEFDKSFIFLLHNVKELIQKHSDSPVEFTKKERFVIADDKYNLSELTWDKLNNYLNKSIEFYKRVYKITSSNEVYSK